MEVTTIANLVIMGLTTTKILQLVAALPNLGKMSVAGGLIKIDAREQPVTVILTIDAHIVLDGTMGSTTVGKGWQRIKEKFSIMAITLMSVLIMGLTSKHHQKKASLS